MSVSPSQQFRNAAVECTHCHQLVRLSEVPIRILADSRSVLALPPPLEILATPPQHHVVQVSPPSPDNSLTDLEETATKTEEPSKWRWSQELKEHFVKAFETLQTRGIHATPKKIMGMMRQNGAPIDQLTMRRVQSHHQKYLKRLKTARSGVKKVKQLHKNLKVEPSEASNARFDRHDLEVARIMENTSSCHTSPRGSPMIFQSPAPSPVFGSSSMPPLISANALPINVLRPQFPQFKATPSSAFQPVSPALPSRPVKFNPLNDTLNSLSHLKQNPWPYMVSGTVVKPVVEKTVPALVNCTPPSSACSSPRLGSFSTEDRLTRIDSESNIFGGLVDHSFALEDSALDIFPTSSLDDGHAATLRCDYMQMMLPSDSCFSSSDDDFDMGFMNEDPSSALDLVA